jgi:hypothetical protein
MITRDTLAPAMSIVWSRVLGPAASSFCRLAIDELNNDFFDEFH